MKKAIVFLAMLATTAFATPRLPIGTYMVSGSNSKWAQGSYSGEVTIQKAGENYQVQWRIGLGHQQGIGILYDDILSIAFLNGSGTHLGVASFKLIADGELIGRWTYADDIEQKPEYLIWKHY